MLTQRRDREGFKMFRSTDHMMITEREPENEADYWKHQWPCCLSPCHPRVSQGSPGWQVMTQEGEADTPGAASAKPNQIFGKRQKQNKTEKNGRKTRG